ncbi:MAG: heavy metal translocating P-type ATPase, partial [Proteobacteria bacterium]|nr:heavy metal translocating P-type ATPase [Pseudomonadota bacterium]
HDAHGHDAHGHDAHGHDAHGHDAHGHDAHGHDAHGHDAHGHDAHGHDAHGHDGDYSTLVTLGGSGLLLLAGSAAEWAGYSNPFGTVAFGLSIAFGAWQVVPVGLRGIWRDRTLDINILVALAATGAIALGDWSEAATVLFLFMLGEAIEGFTLSRTARSVDALLATIPTIANVLDSDGLETPTLVEAVPVGAIVAVRPGERIPVDGVVTRGASAVDQAPLTGESLPVDRAPGDPVFGGTLNRNGYLEVRTTHPFADTALARVVRVAEEAITEPTDGQRLVKRFAKVYTPLVVAVAIIVALFVPWIVGDPIAPWFDRALVLILVACPCALLMASPVAIVAAIGAASRNGVIVRNAVALERAGLVRTVAFDKTGTLTYGLPEVETVFAVTEGQVLDGDLDQPRLARLIRIAGAVEQMSEHPMASAIVRAARAHSPWSGEVTDFQSVPGCGVSAVIDGGQILIGKPNWIAENGCDLSGLSATFTSIDQSGQTPVVLAEWPLEHDHPSPGGPPRPGSLGTVSGVFGIADQRRAEAKDAVDQLRRGGVSRVVVLSGDSIGAVGAVSSAINVLPADRHAGLLPEDKVRLIRTLAAGNSGGVAMVGDGVNDAPALSVATVGIAVGTASADVAHALADVSIVSDDLTRVGWFLGLARRTRWTIIANVTIALFVKVVVAVLAVFGMASLWLAIAADTGATVVVALNGMRLLGWSSVATGSAGLVDRKRFGLAAWSSHAGHAH